jgi:hypothetical protein
VGGRPGAIIMLRRGKTGRSRGGGGDGVPLEILRIRVRGRPESSDLCSRMLYQRAIRATRVRSALLSPTPGFPLHAECSPAYILRLDVFTISRRPKSSHLISPPPAPLPHGSISADSGTVFLVTRISHALTCPPNCTSPSQTLSLAHVARDTVLRAHLR